MVLIRFAVIWWPRATIKFDLIQLVYGLVAQTTIMFALVWFVLVKLS